MLDYIMISNDNNFECGHCYVQIKRFHYRNIVASLFILIIRSASLGGEIRFRVG